MVPPHGVRCLAKDPVPSTIVEDLTAELDAGADVMARDEIGETPLHRAAFAFEGLPANIQILLDAGADVTARTEDGVTTLHLALTVTL